MHAYIHAYIMHERMHAYTRTYAHTGAELFKPALAVPEEELRVCMNDM